ncbi:MAG: dTMP kinase [Chloroflexota bacterium]
MISGLLITFEGPDGSGKTTQIHRLGVVLQQAGHAVLQTREPGGTAIGDQIRRVLHDTANTAMLAATEILLYSASRAQLVGQVIRPALAQGRIVLCDRYAESTLAYQGYGRRLDLEVLRAITAFATGGLRPDLIVYLDIPVEEGLRRKHQAHEREDAEWNRLDREAVDFHRRVGQGYRRLAAAEPERWLIVDARAPVESVHQEIARAVFARLQSWINHAHISAHAPEGG